MDAFDEFPLAEVGESELQKYVVANVESEDGRNKKVVRSRNVNHHNQIFDSLTTVAPGKVTCLGGGALFYSANPKVIRVYGTSGEYGQDPDRNVTIALIASAYPDFKVCT